ncbi:unnamed protein product [Rodentolepis nana]|uniref:EF-hand domain-containing protein n=1 Tax=Rodentolepis nana TaxID=102285 RepID=A0A0R3TP53_RODNA|nr:unnamed protein product [Rodentolepis nana]
MFKPIVTDPIRLDELFTKVNVVSSLSCEIQNTNNTLLAQKVRDEARASLLEAKSAGLLDNEDLADTSTDSGRSFITYPNFLKAKDEACPKAKQYFTATIFAKLCHGERFSRVNILSFFNYVMKTVWLQQTRIGISLYDAHGDGYLREGDLESYISELIPSLCKTEESTRNPEVIVKPPETDASLVDGSSTSEVGESTSSKVESERPTKNSIHILQKEETEELEVTKLKKLEQYPLSASLNGVDDAFRTFYVCTAVRKFLFFLDPLRAGRVRICDILACGFLDNILELREASTTQARLEENWFSLESAKRIYASYLRLDTDQNGMLSRKELAGYNNESLTDAFLDRVFQECLTYEGEMDYKVYLDFVLAMENRSEPQSIAYIFRIVDLGGQGRLCVKTVEYYLNSLLESLGDGPDTPRTCDIINEIFDMIRPKHPDYITLDDLLRSGKGDTVLGILTDVQCFMLYENREALAAGIQADIQFFSPIVFAKLSKMDQFSRVKLSDFCAYVSKMTWLNRTRVEISKYDAIGKGYLVEHELEHYLQSQLPFLQQIKKIERWFIPYYICTISRRFFFFLDPIRVGRVRICDVMASGLLESFFALGFKKEKKSANNHFTLSSVKRAYDNFVKLDINKDGSLSRDELFRMPTGIGHLSKFFVDFFFATHPSRNGVILLYYLTCLQDYRTYMDLVLALENRESTQSIRYLFNAFDIAGHGKLKISMIEDIFNESDRESGLKEFRNFYSFVFDKFKLKDPEYITLNELLNS